MGVSFNEMGEYLKALDVLKKAETYDNERTDIYNSMGFSHFKLKEHEEALERFGGGGCEVDPKSKVVKFPHWVIEEAIESAPRTYYACGRRPEDDVLLEDNRVTFTNFGEGIMFVDPHSGCTGA